TFVLTIKRKEEIEAYISIEDNGIYLDVRFYIKCEYKNQIILKQLPAGSASVKVSLPANIDLNKQPTLNLDCRVLEIFPLKNWNTK
ncbi:16415_t:CDS:2, partial [Cetraspora pellucida]